MKNSYIRIRTDMNHHFNNTTLHSLNKTKKCNLKSRCLRAFQSPSALKAGRYHTPRRICSPKMNCRRPNTPGGFFISQPNRNDKPNSQPQLHTRSYYYYYERERDSHSFNSYNTSFYFIPPSTVLPPWQRDTLCAEMQLVINPRAAGLFAALATRPTRFPLQQVHTRCRQQMNLLWNYS